MAAVYAGTGNLIASAGGDINLQAAQLQADKAGVLLNAAGNINLQTGTSRNPV